MRSSRGKVPECCKAPTNNFRPFEPSPLANSVNCFLIDAGCTMLTGGDVSGIRIRKTVFHIDSISFDLLLKSSILGLLRLVRKTVSLLVFLL